MYSIGESGQLAALNPPSVAPNSHIVDGVIDQSGNYLYASDIRTNSILIFKLNKATGQLTSITSAIKTTAGFALVTTGPYVYIETGLNFV